MLRAVQQQCKTRNTPRPLDPSFRHRAYCTVTYLRLTVGTIQRFARFAVNTAFGRVCMNSLHTCRFAADKLHIACRPLGWALSSLGYGDNERLARGRARVQSDIAVDILVPTLYRQGSTNVLACR